MRKEAVATEGPDGSAAEERVDRVPCRDVGEEVLMVRDGEV